MATLREAKCGQTVKVVKIHGEGAVKRRIMDMGITKNVEIYIRKSIKSQIQNSFPWRSAAKYLQKRKKQERHYWQSART